MSLESLFADAEATLDVAVELTSIKRSDGSTVTWKASRLGVYSSESVVPDLIGLGPFNLALQDDLTFGGLASQSLGSVALEDKSRLGRYDALLDYTFAGRAAVIKIGRRTDAYSSWETYRTCLIDGEPTVSGFGATFQLQTPLARLLQEPLEVDRYAGLPTCARFSTATGVAIAPRVAGSHDLARYTTMVRFRSTGIPSATVRLHAKVVSGTDINWGINLLLTSGAVQGVSTSGGAIDSLITGATNLCDGAWHTVVFARDAGVTSYLMADETVVGTDAALTGSPTLSVANIEFGRRTSGTQAVDICDARLYDRYIPPDEARVLQSVRAQAGDLGLVGYWPFTDNAGASGNDEGSGNSDAAISGVVNTDYSWQPTDLGEPELAGTQMPLVLGVPFNVKPHLIDQARERYRLADTDVEDLTVGTRDIDLRARGTVLGLTTDYTYEGDGVYKMNAAEDEPVTADVSSEAFEDYLPEVATRALWSRTRITTSMLHMLQAGGLSYLLPWRVGYFGDSEITAAALLQQLVGGAGGCYYEDAAGKLFLDFLLPPLSSGPYGEPCLDFRGQYGSLVNFGNIAGTTGSHTLACWFKTHATDASSLTSDALQAPPIGQFLIDRSANYRLTVDLEGGSAGRIGFWNTAGPSVENLYSPPGLLESGYWYFIAAVLDNSAKTRNIYVGKKGGTLALVASDSGWTGSPINPPSDLCVGGNDDQVTHNWGAVGYAQVWHTTKNLAALQALMATPPVGNEANLAMFAPMNEGSGTTVSEKVASGTGTFSSGPTYGAPVWAPRLSVNLDETPSARLTEIKRGAPVWKAVVRYARNWHPMTDADIDTGVSQSNRIRYTREWKDVSARSETVRATYSHAKELLLETCLTDREDAQRLARYLMYRHSTDRVMAVLSLPGGLAVSRRALALNFGDEVLVTSTRHGLSAGRSFRAVSLRPNLFDQSAQLALWG